MVAIWVVTKIVFNCSAVVLFLVGLVGFGWLWLFGWLVRLGSSWGVLCLFDVCWVDLVGWVGLVGFASMVLLL